MTGDGDLDLGNLGRKNHLQQVNQVKAPPNLPRALASPPMATDGMTMVMENAIPTFR